MKFYIQLGSQLPSQLANEKKWEQLQQTLDNSNRKRDKAMKHKFVLGNKSLRYRMLFFASFAEKVVLL